MNYTKHQIFEKARTKTSAEKDGSRGELPENSNLASPKITSGIKLLKQAWGIYKINWKKFVLLMFLPLAGIISLLLVLIVYALLAFLKNNGYLNQITVEIITVVLVILGLAAFLAIIYLFLWVYLGIIYLIGERDKNITTITALRKSYKKVISLLWIFVLIGVITVIGYLLFIIPGIVWSIMFSFALYVLVFEDIKGWAALKRSRELVRDFWFTVFARFIVISFILLLVNLIFIFLPAIILIYLFERYGGIIWLISQIINSFLNLIITPLSLSVFYLLYRELRQIKEKEEKARDGMTFFKKILWILAALLYIMIFVIISYFIP